MTRAPIANPTLAKIMAQERNPVERLSSDQASIVGVWTVGVARPDLIKHGRVVQLDCGHYTLTKALRKAGCPRCGEMIRAGYDYDGFRRLGALDDFSWPDDPFRTVHEQSECDVRSLQSGI